MMRSVLALTAVGLLAAAGRPLLGQGTKPAGPPAAAPSRVDETVQLWTDIGDKLVAMAKDFPEAKFDYKLQQDQRTFAQNLLHVAAVDYILMRAATGTAIGPDFGKDPENPSRDAYKTKAAVAALVAEAVADGARLIKAGGPTGLDRMGTYPWANRLDRASFLWQDAVEHSGEHYGQLVVYYRANGLVPPASR